MTEIPISPNVWMLAQAILTQKQLVVLELREKRGFSWNQISIALDCTRANSREHHRAATRNLLGAIERAGGIEEALEVVAPTPDHHEGNIGANIAAIEETPEEKNELDHLWRESAEPRPASERPKKEVAWRPNM